MERPAVHHVLLHLVLYLLDAFGQIGEICRRNVRH